MGLESVSKGVSAMELQHDKLPKDWRNLPPGEVYELIRRYVEMEVLLPSEARAMLGLPPLKKGPKPPTPPPRQA